MTGVVSVSQCPVWPVSGVVSVSQCPVVSVSQCPVVCVIQCPMWSVSVSGGLRHSVSGVVSVSFRCDQCPVWSVSVSAVTSVRCGQCQFPL